MIKRWSLALAGVVIAALVLTAVTARAQGVTRVQQSDGSVQIYRDVHIRLSGETLWLRSPDRKGVLEIVTGACFAGTVERCLPITTTLHQAGTTHEIALEHGTVYLNLTSDAQHLRHASEPLQPHGVLILLKTIRGTYVSVRGTLDEIQ